MIARTSQGRGERVVIAGHIDTVPVNRNLPSRVEGDRLYGCGTGDMKAGVAVQLKLADVPRTSRDVTYFFYECEEIEEARNGLKRIGETRPELLDADFAVLMEPSGGIDRGRLPGHDPGRRDGAGRAGAQRAVLDGLERHPQRRRGAGHPARRTSRGGPVVDGLEFREGLNAVFVRGGVAGNVIPDECVVTLNYRFAPDRRRRQRRSTCARSSAAGDRGRRRVRRPARAHAPGRRGVRRGGRRGAAGQARLDRRRAVLRARHPGGQLRSRRAELSHTRDEYVEIGKIAECESRLRAWLDGG